MNAKISNFDSSAVAEGRQIMELGDDLLFSTLYISHKIEDDPWAPDKVPA